MILAALFFETLSTQPVYFVSVVFTVVVSITLHELSHGWAALWQGDDTPRVTGHMTANPIVHMGWFSFLLLATTGMAFGMMPVNPVRFRSRYGDALVAAAGPAMNLLLAAVALVALGLWMRSVGHWTDGDKTPLVANTQQLLWYFGVTNVALAILNLLPIPPLDGSKILANFHKPYRDAIRSVQDPSVFFVALMGLLVLLSYTDFGLFDLAVQAGLWVVNTVGGMSLALDR